ncbi:NUDIX domain-containing protein [Mesotoga prima]|uniref:NUDIX domain-containing protein n=1 Tax=Mesotoga prima TaxID=1184387 RepID=UPI002CBB1368|nr:NUDIX domain-containing protein [Mesotoga prima]HOZ99847.1 NUDIX domain-containing protein [Mesotoga prima]HPE52663.1 NUDIX domain-containing protein [Mesotoga prima]HQC14281.1 NUDIX domain-containing protein [Mesotoga prima]HQN60284.1 NUDIX domain-containing protein [Mesotoga prima]HUM22499.1 NUDIX domain-containing protein [Mesotoga prima]
MEERVLVVDVDCLGELATRNGLLALPLDEIKMRVERFGRFVRRSEAENDESMRQIIPYAVFRNRDEYLLMKRTKKQGEARLHELYSIGVGGHINLEDGRLPWEAFENGFQREIREEVSVKIHSMDYLGILNDLQTEVSRVHIGVVYIAEVDFGGFNEKEKFTGAMAEIKVLSEYRESMETWSQIVLDYLLLN